MKPWWQSKTVWLNVLTAVTAMAIALGDTQIVRDNPQWAATVATVVSVLNLVLRWGGTRPIR